MPSAISTVSRPHPPNPGPDVGRLSDEERRLFRDAMAGVRRQRPAAESRRGPPRRRSGGQPSGAPAVPAAGATAVLEYLQPGEQRAALERLRTRRFDAQAELDLHGRTAQEAAAELRRFIAHCRAEGLERLRVIHGKGWRSDSYAPVLKTRVYEELKRHPSVRALRSAQGGDGGTGALRVLLSRR